jgi:hypothetical protein
VRGWGRAIVALAAALAGCATPPPPPPEAFLAVVVRHDLRGSWTGTWGGTPLSVLITDQSEDGDSTGGVYLGSYLLLGERSPTLSGVMTYTRKGEAVSVSVRGWTHSSGGAVAVTLTAAAPDGILRLALRGATPERLAGTGESDFRWGPQGAVQISRTTRREAEPPGPADRWGRSPTRHWPGIASPGMQGGANDPQAPVR